MADDLTKKGPTSVPPSVAPSSVPPPTDEIDQDWGTARSAPTHVAPLQEEHAEDEDEDDEEDEDEDDEDEDAEEDDGDDEDEDEDEADAQRSGVTPHASNPDADSRPSDDSLPDWVPWVVLAALVIAGIAGALGAFSGS